MRPSVTANHETREKRSSSNVIQIDSDDDEFEDASESFNVDDDYFVDNVSSKRTEPLSEFIYGFACILMHFCFLLVPDNVEDEIVGTICFSEQFTARYGPVHPAFYQGTLEDAIKEACAKSAKDVS